MNLDRSARGMRSMISGGNARVRVPFGKPRPRLLVPEQARMAEDQRMEVPTGHVGLVYNPEVYRAVGRFLSTMGGATDWQSVSEAFRRRGRVILA